MRRIALLILLTLPLAMSAGEPRVREVQSGPAQQCCLFGCRCGERDNGQTAILMQILQNQQQIITLLSQGNRGAAPQTQPPVVINMPAPRGELQPGAPKGDIPYSAPKGDIPGGPPRGDIPGTPPKGDIPGGAPRGEITPMDSPTPPVTEPRVREIPGGDLPSTPPAKVNYQEFSVRKPYYEPAWKPVKR